MRSLALVSIALLFAAPALADEPLRAGAAHSQSPAAGSPTTAAASETPGAKAPAEASPDTWYGYQTLLADTASVGLLFLAAGSESGEGLLGTALVSMGAASPTIHLVHGRPLAAAGSLLVRAMAVTMGGWLGYAAAKGGGDADVSMVGGGLLGYATASLFDAIVLAWEPGTTRERTSSGIRSVAPSVDPRSGAAGVIVGGSF